MKQFTLLKKYAHGEIEINLVDFTERLLMDSNDSFAKAVFRIAFSTDRVALWSRLDQQIQRVFYTTRTEEEIITWAEGKSLLCTAKGCEELSVQGMCDYCITK